MGFVVTKTGTTEGVLGWAWLEAGGASLYVTRGELFTMQGQDMQACLCYDDVREAYNQAAEAGIWTTIFGNMGFGDQGDS